MIRKTRELRKLINQYEDIPDRVKQLKDFYKGESCYIVACGPSLTRYDGHYLNEKLEDKLVITIKQAFKTLETISDFHVLSFTNYVGYDYYSSPNTITVWEVFEPYHPDMILRNNFRCDIMLPVVGNHEPDTVKRMDDSQAGKNSFSNWGFDKSLDRQFGPGIMYEIVIHLAMYLGVSEITTLGWDIGDTSKFKGDDPYETIWNDHNYGYGKERISYAPTGMNFYEIETVAKSTKYLHQWLKKNGIDFRIDSDRNPAWDGIERVSL